MDLKFSGQYQIMTVKIYIINANSFMDWVIHQITK